MIKEKIIKRIVKELCIEKGIELKELSFGWIIQLYKDRKFRYIVRNSFDLNSDAVGTIISDKYATYEVLKKNNIPVVEHRIIFNPETRAEYASEIEYFNGNMVVKPNDGTSGQGVNLCNTIEEVEKFAKELFKTEDAISICPYYDIDIEYRVFYLDGECLYIYGKKAKASWKHNLHEGAIPIMLEDNELRAKIEQIAINAAKVLNIKFATIDIIHTKDDKLYVMECNTGVSMEIFIEKIDSGYKIAKEIYGKAIDKMFE